MGVLYWLSLSDSSILAPTGSLAPTLMPGRSFNWSGQSSDKIDIRDLSVPAGGAREMS